MTREVNKMEDLQGILNEAGDRLVVVVFYGEWCRPCKIIDPQFEEASKNPKYQNVIFVKVNVDENDETASACVFASIASFHFFKNKKMIDVLFGKYHESFIDKLEACMT